MFSWYSRPRLGEVWLDWFDQSPENESLMVAQLVDGDCVVHSAPESAYINDDIYFRLLVETSIARSEAERQIDILRGRPYVEDYHLSIGTEGRGVGRVRYTVFPASRPGPRHPWVRLMKRVREGDAQ